MSQYTTESFQKYERKRSTKRSKQYSDSNTERKSCKKDSYKVARDMKRQCED
jgi:hypothetical protein